MKEKIIDYSIVAETTAYNLADTMRIRIREGWEPQGGAFVDGAGRFCQAIVRKQISGES